MPNYIPYDPSQSKMVIINYADQLQPGTFEHAIHFLIEHKLDLSIFDPSFKNDSTGRPAYAPAILLKILLFAYSKGITSSREIQWNCESNIIFKALSCDTVPHFTTIANFVSGYSDEIEILFEQVLLICDEQGLLGKELFAIDGCKMSSNAAKEWSGTHKELKQKRDKIQHQIQHHITEHKKLDKNESRDDERRVRSEQAIETLTKAHEKIDQFLKCASPRMGKGRIKKEVKSNITDNESAKMTTSKGTIQGYNGIATVDKKHQIIVDAQVFGEGQEHHVLEPVLNSVRNRFKRLRIEEDIYREGTVVTADTGYACEANMKYLHENEINGYIPDNKFRQRDPKFSKQKESHGKRKSITGRKKVTKKVTANKIPSSEFDFDPANKTCVCPANENMRLGSELIDRLGHAKIFFEGRLTKCRACELKGRCMHNPESANDRNGHGRQVSFIIKKGKRAPNYTDWMKHRIDSDKGKLIYSHRMSVVEPVFGNIGWNKRLNRFSLRGKKKVQCQWQLYCLIHNIEKLKNYGELAT
ncbi:Transposase [hydrothermal vent metagenome]|uniref:Transposase n=1 Tax=hydrothermal vent metagenome TaxID=652676 RepID=A0A3B0Z4H0_9ZZZZ